METVVVTMLLFAKISMLEPNTLKEVNPLEVRSWKLHIHITDLQEEVGPLPLLPLKDRATVCQS